MTKLLRTLHPHWDEKADGPGVCPVCQIHASWLSEHISYMHGWGSMRRSIREKTFEVDDEAIALMALMPEGPERRKAWLSYLAGVEAESPEEDHLYEAERALYEDD